MSQIWALHDSDPGAHSMVRIRPEDAERYNQEGYGIFHTVQEFNGPRRIANLARINAWAIDIDESPKANQLARLKQGLVPTLVVESKRGYHVYWKAKDAVKEHWDAIVLDRLVPFYRADPRARDLARILRRPGYLHLKDPKDPFLVRKVWEWPVTYSELEMAQFYPSSRSPAAAAETLSHAKRVNAGAGTFWDRVWGLNCEDALARLSGTEHVGGETYQFKPNSTGTKNIYVNGKSTSCWIDRDGKIGSLDGGGPGIYQWLMWFHKNPARVAGIIQKVFPECNRS